MKVHRTVPVALLCATLFAAILAGAESDTEGQPLLMEEFRVPSSDAGIEIYVRSKRPAGLAAFGPQNIVLFVHGATYPAETTFDLRLDGISWMDYVAQRGYEVYLVDLRGYGKSTRPPEMSEPPERNGPIVRTQTAVKDVASAVNFILRRRHVPKINLIGWSWGCAIMARYTTENNERVSKLILHAPQWLRGPQPTIADKLGAYRAQDREQGKERWISGIPMERRAEILPARWLEQWAEATWATDQIGAKQSPPVLRAPNGVIQDSREFWESGKPLYDASQIRVPTFLVVGKWDVITPPSMLHGCFAALTNTPAKRFAEIEDGTHHVMMEKNRMRLFEAVQQFLDERLPATP